MKLVDPVTKKGAYVVWAPTSDGTSVSGYSLAVASGITSASVVTLADQSTTGNEASATITAGKVSLDVTETPTFVLVDAEP